MYDIPVIRIELDGVKQRVSHIIGEKNNELNKLVINSIETQINEAWFIAEINEAVNQLLKQSIKNMANSYQLQNAISELVVDAVEKIVKNKP